MSSPKLPVGRPVAVMCRIRGMTGFCRSAWQNFEESASRMQPAMAIVYGVKRCCPRWSIPGRMPDVFAAVLQEGGSSAVRKLQEAVIAGVCEVDDEIVDADCLRTAVQPSDARLHESVPIESGGVGKADSGFSSDDQFSGCGDGDGESVSGESGRQLMTDDLDMARGGPRVKYKVSGSPNIALEACRTEMSR
ncbi:hypothetical protein ABW21_db0209521 [Orbilia brochopaga]|nr:hypothetical protein ABW21_db0209521 [Drechslerella brochopaga]